MTAPHPHGSAPLASACPGECVAAQAGAPRSGAGQSSPVHAVASPDTTTHGTAVRAPKYLSVCSGIEAATQAWHPLGWKPIAFSEIEPFPCAVLAHHYPDVPNWGDMTKFQEWPDANVDVLAGGTPCQSFSVAGMRKGLDDPRGNLMLTFGAIADRYRPRWLVWENVPGVLSSNGGRDFGSFLGMLGQLGYGWAYRTLDAQHVRTCRFPHAVPQRRRRVFVVGYFGDWRRAAAVLFDRESLSGHPAPRREAGQGSAGRPTRGTGSGKPTFGTLMANAGTKLWLGNQEALTGDYHILEPIAFGWQNSASQGDSVSKHVTPTLDKSKTPAVCGTMLSRQSSGGFSNSIDHAAGGYMIPVTETAVRRITPRECERLQGFPDDYTLTPHRGKPAADGPRYKALGNSWAVNCADWIGQRIAEVDAWT